MPTISATTQPLRWTVVEAGVIIEAGLTPVGATTIAAEANQLIGEANENALLEALITANAGAPPLPEAGTELEQGDIYDHSGTLYMVRQAHTRTEHDPATVPALFWSYREDTGDALPWIAGEQVYAGTQRMYDDALYQCVQAHTTQADWTPPAVPALWTAVSLTDEWAVGVAYTGDNTAGAGNGDVVTYEGTEYRCLQSHTSQAGWTPPAVPALWAVL